MGTCGVVMAERLHVCIPDPLDAASRAAKVKCWINLRYTVPDRLEAFVAGIERHGYKAEIGFPDRIGPKDLFITWNRINMGNTVAQRFQDQGLPVIVAENAAWGNEFLGRRWYSLARNYHNTSKCAPITDRWDRLDFHPEPYREGKEIVILPQRGIGSPPTRMPAGWAHSALSRYGGRVRQHPGTKACIPLIQDLAHAKAVVTWGSGAAIKAALWGIPVFSEMPNWIGWHQPNDRSREEMLCRVADCQWQLSEIESGEAFSCLLHA